MSSMFRNLGSAITFGHMETAKAKEARERYIERFGRHEERHERYKELADDAFIKLEELWRQVQRGREAIVETGALSVDDAGNLQAGWYPVEESARANINVSGERTAFLGGAGMVAAGIGAPAAAWIAVGALGTASTGAAIGGLSGAAATSATAAWFGGGAGSGRRPRDGGSPFRSDRYRSTGSGSCTGGWDSGSQDRGNEIALIRSSRALRKSTRARRKCRTIGVGWSPSCPRSHQPLMNWHHQRQMPSRPMTHDWPRYRRCDPHLRHTVPRWRKLCRRPQPPSRTPAEVEKSSVR